MAAPALAQESCESSESSESCEARQLEDEIDMSDFSPPVIPSPRTITPTDPRGAPLSLPLAGSPVIRYRPGAGVWVGEVGEGNNLFVTARRNKAMLGLRREF